jgi:hypothetical protein
VSHDAKNDNSDRRTGTTVHYLLIMGPATVHTPRPVSNDSVPDSVDTGEVDRSHQPLVGDWSLRSE